MPPSKPMTLVARICYIYMRQRCFRISASRESTPLGRRPRAVWQPSGSWCLLPNGRVYSTTRRPIPKPDVVTTGLNICTEFEI